VDYILPDVPELKVIGVWENAESHRRAANRSPSIAPAGPIGSEQAEVHLGRRRLKAAP
jgi:hypothetical protein